MTVVQVALGSDAVDDVLGCRSATIALESAAVAVDGHLDVVLVGTIAGTPVGGLILAADGHNAVSAAGDACTKV